MFEHATPLSESVGLSYMGLYTALYVANVCRPSRLDCPTGVDDPGKTESRHGCGTACAIGARKSARMSVVGKIIVNEMIVEVAVEVWVESDERPRGKHRTLICELDAWFAWRDFAPK